MNYGRRDRVESRARADTSGNVGRDGTADARGKSVRSVRGRLVGSGAKSLETGAPHANGRLPETAAPCRAPSFKPGHPAPFPTGGIVWQIPEIKRMRPQVQPGCQPPTM